MTTPIKVWMSAWRTGETYHQVIGGHGDDLRTACGRGVRLNGTELGYQVPDWAATYDKGATPCERCWPEGRSS